MNCFTDALYAPVRPHRRRNSLLVAAVTALLSILLLSYGRADVSLPGFTETRVASLSRPIAMEFASDGRIFATEQDGKIRIIKNGVLLPTPFATLPVFFGASGLLGITLHPNFPTTPYVYVYYTSPGPPHYNRVSRLTADGDLVVPGSEIVFVQWEKTNLTNNHDGGALHFGPDGKLYVSTGENNVRADAQSLETIKGKILRLNGDGTIPEDNPFYTTTTGQNRAIWCYGLRNPFTFAFQPGSGRMFINDLGLHAWEEINEGVAGGNYGWPTTEGPTDDPRFLSPLFAYPHTGSGLTGCGIIGGDFYNPTTHTFPRPYWDSYFIMDWCVAGVFALDMSNGFAHTLFASGLNGPAQVRVGPDGSLYYLRRGVPGGALFRVTYAAQVSGTVTLEDCRNSAQPLTFEFRPTNGGPVFTRSATLDSNGNFLVTDIPVGAYQMAAKGEKWLQRVKPVDTTDGFVTGVTLSLLAGDANDDNSVDVLDLDWLIQAFDADPNAPNWKKGADLNCDNSVDVLDLDLLIRNFDVGGDV